MKLPVRASLLAVALSSAGAAAWYAPPQWAAEVAELWRGDETEWEADRAAAEEAHRQQLGQLRTRQQMMRSAVDDVVEGRVTLAEATALFTELNKEPRDLTPAIRTNYPAATERESVARQVIGWAKSRVGGNSSRARQLAARLNRELAAMRAGAP